MANDPQTLTIEPGPWGTEADRLIGLSVQHATPADIRFQVEHQGARLFYVKAQGQIVAAFVLRVDELPAGPEGVIVAAAGKVQGIDLMATCMPTIESLFVNCKTIRFHTAVAAVARRMAAFGYHAREIVCMKEIKQNEPVAA